jgi:predicted dienelactone hydrolase
MRPLESVIIGLLTAASLTLFQRPSRRWRWLHGVVPMAAIVAVVQWRVEGYRWPLVPTYGLVALWLFATALKLPPRHSVRTPSRAPGRIWARRLGGAFAVIGVAVCALPPLAFPHLVLPRPSGPFAVGTTNLLFVDDGREETFTEDPDDRREIAARIWYPAVVPADGTTVSYCENAHEVSRVLTQGTPFPSFLFDHLALVRAHSYRDAEVAGGGARFPVVIFSHAYWAGISQSTVLMEDLASHGYVVVSIGHAYETPYFVEADGSIRPFDPRNEAFRARGAERGKALPLTAQLTLTRDRGRLEALLRAISEVRPESVKSVHIWADDISSTIDELERLDRGEGPMAGRLDLDRIAAIGHSFGGAASGQACLDDERCKAGVNIDGLQLGSMIDRPLRRPFMFIHHDNRNAVNKAPNITFFEAAEAPSYLMIIEGSEHLSFTDLSLSGRLSVFRRLAPLGRIDGRRCHRILGDHVLAFLDEHLRGRESSLLKGFAPGYPEVSMQTRVASIPDRRR